MLTSFTTVKQVRIRDWRLAWLNLAIMGALAALIAFNIARGTGRKMEDVHTEATLDLRGNPIRFGDYKGTIPNSEGRHLFDQRCAPTGLYEVDLTSSQARTCIERINHHGMADLTPGALKSPYSCPIEYGERIVGVMQEKRVVLAVGDRVEILADTTSDGSQSSPVGVPLLKGATGTVAKIDELRYAWVSFRGVPEDQFFWPQNYGRIKKETSFLHRMVAAGEVDKDSVTVWHWRPHGHATVTEGIWVDAWNDFHHFGRSFEGGRVLVLKTAQELAVHSISNSSVTVTRRDGTPATGTFGGDEIQWSSCPGAFGWCVWRRPPHFFTKTVRPHTVGTADGVVAIDTRLKPSLALSVLNAVAANSKDSLRVLVNGTTMSTCRTYNRDDYVQKVRRLDRDRMLLTSCIEYQSRPKDHVGEEVNWTFAGYDQIVGNLAKAEAVVAFAVKGAAQDGMHPRGVLYTCDPDTGKCADPATVELTTTSWLGVNTTHLYLKVADLINRTNLDMRRCVDYSRCVVRINIELRNHLLASWRRSIANWEFPVLSGFGDIEYSVRISGGTTDVMYREMSEVTFDDGPPYQVIKTYAGLVLALSVDAHFGRLDFTTLFAYFGSTVGVIFASAKLVSFFAKNFFGRHRHQLYKTYLTETSPDLHDVEEFAKEFFNGDEEQALSQLAKWRLREQLTIGDGQLWRYEKNIDRLLENSYDTLRKRLTSEDLDGPQKERERLPPEDLEIVNSIRRQANSQVSP